MENFKDDLNKMNNGYTFIKFNDLEQGKLYKVNKFIMIDTMFGKRISVVLNDEYMLNLPDRYKKKFTENKITWYNTSSETRLNLIYNCEKILKNGKTRHDFIFK